MVTSTNEWADIVTVPWVTGDNSQIILYVSEVKFDEILNPFFSKDEILKGETEVIAGAIFLYESNYFYRFILDDIEARKFIDNNLAFLCDKLTNYRIYWRLLLRFRHLYEIIYITVVRYYRILTILVHSEYFRFG